MRRQQYFVTHGRGTEEFLLNELHALKETAFDANKSADLAVDECVEGKLSFSTNLPVGQLLQLKTVERIFASLLFVKFVHTSTLDPPAPVPVVKSNQIASLLARIDSSLRPDYFDSAHFSLVLATYSNNRAGDGGHNNHYHNDEAAAVSNKRSCVTKKFRINCKLTGKYRKLESLRETIVENVANKLKCINAYFDVSLDEPNFEIIVHLSETCLAMGIQLTPHSLSVRSYIRHVGLRSTICAIMIQLLERDCGDHHKDGLALVLDPFCGKATIFAEYFGILNERPNTGAKCCRYFLLGSDSSSDQLACSAENLSGFDASRYNLLQANLLKDSSSLPYRDEIADIIVTDVPFGQTHHRDAFQEKPAATATGQKVAASSCEKLKLSSQRAFYTRLLIEFNRLLSKPHGFAVVLMNSKEEHVLENVIEQELAVNADGSSPSIKSRYRFTTKAKHRLSLGETNATLYKLEQVLQSPPAPS